MSAEVSRANAAELSLTTRVSGETSRASSAETSLESNLSTEVSRANAAELSLTTRVSGETSRASSAETSLNAKINTINTDNSAAVSTEASRALAAETTLTSNLNTLTARVDVMESGVSVISINPATGAKTGDSLSAGITAKNILVFSAGTHAGAGAGELTVALDASASIYRVFNYFSSEGPTGPNGDPAVYEAGAMGYILTFTLNGTALASVAPGEACRILKVGESTWYAMPGI